MPKQYTSKGCIERYFSKPYAKPKPNFKTRMSTTSFATKTTRLSLRELPEDSYMLHATNCLATWGAGIAADLADIFPEACKVYKAFCNAAKPNAGDRWPPQSLAGQCLVIPPQAGDVAKGAPSVHIVCLFTSYGFGAPNRATGKPGKDSADKILRQTRTSLKSLRKQLDESTATTGAGGAGKKAAVYSPMFNSGAFKVPWEKTLEVIEEEFEGANATWTVVLPPA